MLVFQDISKLNCNTMSSLKFKLYIHIPVGFTVCLLHDTAFFTIVLHCFLLPSLKFLFVMSGVYQELFYIDCFMKFFRVLQRYCYKDNLSSQKDRMGAEDRALPI